MDIRIEGDNLMAVAGTRATCTPPPSATTPPPSSGSWTAIGRVVDHFGFLDPGGKKKSKSRETLKKNRHKSSEYHVFDILILIYGA